MESRSSVYVSEEVVEIDYDQDAKFTLFAFETWKIDQVMANLMMRK